MPGTCEDAAKKAEEWADNLGSAPPELSKVVCWDAVLLCVKAAGVPLPKNCETVKNPTQACYLVPPIGVCAIEGAGAMTNMQRGHVIMFYDLMAKDPKTQAKHAMISIGGGYAIGSNNGGIHSMEDASWHKVNLLNSGRYLWGKGGIFTSKEGRVSQPSIARSPKLGCSEGRFARIEVGVKRIQPLVECQPISAHKRN